MSRNPDFLLVLALESSSGNCNLFYCGQRASPGTGGVCTAAPPPTVMQQDWGREKQCWGHRGHTGSWWGCLGPPPSGDNMLVGGEPMALLHCTRHHPAPPWPSLPLLGAAKRPFLPNVVPSLSCSIGGRSLQDVLGPGLPWFRA